MSFLVLTVTGSGCCELPFKTKVGDKEDATATLLVHTMAASFSELSGIVALREKQQN